MTTIFEGIMIFCWGVSWPAAVIKTYRTKSIDGVSIVFLWFVFSGYISGLLFKITEASSDGTINPVIVLYIFNFLLVGIELILYYRYRRRKPETGSFRG